MNERKVMAVIEVKQFLKYIRKKRVWVCFVCNGVDVHMICNKINDVGAETQGIVKGIGFFGNESHVELRQECHEVRVVALRPGCTEKAYEMIFDDTNVFVSENSELYGH
jgi:hypothetical protein|nr:MAG TPA: hypothetical protein [Bacteriophage sp.]